MLSLFLGCLFIRSFSYLQVMMTYIRALRSSNFCKIRLVTAELAALERLKNPHRLIIGKMLLPRFLSYAFIKSFSYLHVTMTYIRAWMTSKFGQIRSGTTKLAALEHLKSQCCPFLSLYLGNSQVSFYMTICPMVLIYYNLHIT